MPISTNMKELRPRRQAYKREFTLLSKGFSAPNAWPGGKITIYPWDSEIDEVAVEASRSGKNVLYTVLEKVCGMNGASVDQFVFSEITSVLLIARSIQFDGAIEYESVCPFCSATDRESIVIPNELELVGEKNPGYPGYDEITLPDCKDVVRIRPLLVGDQKKIEDRTDQKYNIFSAHKLALMFPIVSVNGGKPDTLEEVANYCDALSPSDVDFLEDQQSKLSPKLENRLPHKCKRCKKKFHHVLMFDQEFFRARGAGKPASATEENVSAGLGREGIPPKPEAAKRQ